MKRLIPKSKYNSLTIIKEVEPTGYNRNFKCRCDCGKLKIIRLGHLTSGKISSCGCVRDLLASKRATTHGMAGNKTYRSWQHMKERCLNKNCADWIDYGGRGISVCNRWLKFENFLADMGEKPTSKHSIDRKNNDGNYTPSNCKWSTAIEQANNKRNNRTIIGWGLRKTLSQWSMETGIKRELIIARIDSMGWKPERALKQPVRKHKKYSFSKNPWNGLSEIEN